jgi:hypothetical protein
MDNGWCFWSILFHKRLRNRPQSLVCDLTVPYSCFPPFACLSASHSPFPARTLLLGWCPRYITHWLGPRVKHCFQHFLYCCAWTLCRGNLFVSRSLPSNGSTRYVHTYTDCESILYSKFCFHILNFVEKIPRYSLKKVNSIWKWQSMLCIWIVQIGSSNKITE